MSDLDEALEEDKRQHPKCGYSKQFSREVKDGVARSRLVSFRERENEVRGDPTDIPRLPR